MNRQKGFSLVELMVVIVLMALMMTLGMPAYKTWKMKNDQSSYMQKLLSDLQYARMKAYGEKTVWGVYLDSTTTPFTYTVRRDTGGTANCIDNADTIQSTVKFSTSVTAAVVSPSNAGNVYTSVFFGGRGFAGMATDCTTQPTADLVFYISGSPGAAFDCVYVTASRIDPGKWNAATTTCTPK